MSQSAGTSALVAARLGRIRASGSTRIIVALAAFPVFVIAVFTLWFAFDLPTLNNSRLPVSAAYDPIAGTWTATSGGCDNDGVICQWTGTFRPAAGGDTVRNAYLASSLANDVSLGDTIQVVAVPEGTTYWVYAKQSTATRSAGFWVAMTAAFAVFIFGCWLVAWAIRGIPPGLARLLELEYRLAGP